MDNVNMNLEQKYRKTNRKDGGDLIKDNKCKREPDLITKPKISHSGGDDENKVNKIELRNANLFKANAKVVNNDTPKDNLITRIVKAEQELAFKKAQNDNEATKKTRNKNAIKPKTVVNKVVKKEDLNKNMCNEIDSVKIDQPTKRVAAKDKDGSQDTKSPLDKSTLPQRRPLVKTVTKNDACKTYKEVSFVNDKNKTRTLCVNIPITYNSKTSETSTESKPVKTKVKNKGNTVSSRNKADRKHNRVVSPEARANPSPPTEVSKWTSPPSCLNTKSYHEAWVRTTLDAMSRSAKKDKLYLEKQRIIERFQRSMAERPSTPRLFHNDEMYIGKIRVRQR